MFSRMIFVLRAVREKIYCFTVCSMNCVRVTVTVDVHNNWPLVRCL